MNESPEDVTVTVPVTMLMSSRNAPPPSSSAWLPVNSLPDSSTDTSLVAVHAMPLIDMPPPTRPDWLETNSLSLKRNRAVVPSWS